MAKISGPLHSLDAFGAFGSAIIFGKQNGATVARSMARYKSTPPGQPAAGPTQAQIARRALYKEACNWWQAMTPAQRAAYQPAADAAGLTLFSAAISSYMIDPSSHITYWDGGATTWDAGATTWDFQ